MRVWSDEETNGAPVQFDKPQDKQPGEAEGEENKSSGLFGWFGRGNSDEPKASSSSVEAVSVEPAARSSLQSAYAGDRFDSSFADEANSYRRDDRNAYGDKY